MTRTIRTRTARGVSAGLLVSVLLASCATRKPGEIPRPGFNSYTKEQDIEIGRQAAAEANRQVTVVDNRQLQDYVSSLGERLASQPAADQYPYSFTVINDPSINAFALPGGPVYLNSGVLRNADNEAQVAGVLAHEISHVALRHGTNQASKAQLFDLAGGLAGAALGTNTVGGQLGQLGLGLGLSTVLLKYSRTAESEADALGARIMSASGYDPVEMARFFEKLEEMTGGDQPAEFLSSHPNPGNRVKAVEEEIPFLPPATYNAGTGNFAAMKRIATQLPPPPERNQAQR